MHATLSRRAAMLAPMLSAFAVAPGALAAGWRPTRPVRIVVPSTAGGTTDVMARLLAQHLTPRWGQPVVVDNRGGAGGTIGTLEVVRAAPDGHTLLMGNVGPQSIAYALARNLQYGPEDLVPISNMIQGPNVLVVNPSVPATTVPEFVAHLRRNPDRLSYGTPGVGQTPHLAGVWFNQLAGTRSVPVHYRGSGPAHSDLFAGVIEYIFDALVNQVEPIRAGRVRPLAVTGTERWPLLPELPALRETMPEFASFTVTSWVGLFAPKGTPDAVVRSVNAEIRDLLQAEGTRPRFMAMGGLPSYGTPEQFAAFVRRETEKWAQVIRREGLQVDLI